MDTAGSRPLMDTAGSRPLQESQVKYPICHFTQHAATRVK